MGASQRGRGGEREPIVTIGTVTDAAEWARLLSALLDGRDLRVAEATWAMEQVMAGRGHPPRPSPGFLVALRAKGETVDEIVGFRDAVLAHAVPLPRRARWPSTSSARAATASAR